MNSYMQKKETVTRNWYVIDAEGKPLGRVASKAAVVLRGKHKPLIHLMLIVVIMLSLLMLLKYY